MNEAKKSLKSLIKSILNIKSQEELDDLIRRMSDIEDINLDVFYAAQNIAQSRRLLSAKLNKIKEMCDEYILEEDKKTDQWIIGLSKVPIRDIANGYSEFEAYIKDIFNNKEDLADPNKLGYATTTVKEHAKIFNSKEEANSIAQQLKEETDWRTVAAVILDNKKVENLTEANMDPNMLFANLSQLQKTIQQKTGCSVNIESDTKNISIIISGDSTSLMNAMDYGDEVRKFFEQQGNEVYFEAQNNKFIYTIKLS